MTMKKIFLFNIKTFSLNNLPLPQDTNKHPQENIHMRDQLLYTCPIILKDIIYYTPYQGNRILLFYITTKTIETIPIQNLENMECKFNKSLVHENMLYFIPSDMNTIGMLELKSHQYKYINISNARKCYKYATGCTVNDKLYYLPCNSKTCGVYDIAKQVFNDLELQVDMKNGMFGSAHVYENEIYCIPFVGNDIVRINSNNDTITKVPLEKEEICLCNIN